MTAPPRNRASRRRSRRVRTGPLILLAVGVALAVFVGRGATQLAAANSCTAHAVRIDVAASPDIASAISQIAAVYDSGRHRTSGRCIAVQVTSIAAADAAARIDGQQAAPRRPAIDAWIPDSSLWITQVRAFPLGAQTVQPAGFSVARSPLLLVMPPAAAARTPAFARAGWRLLLPRSAGGPAVPAGLRVEVPDPARHAAGLATLIEVSRLLGGGRSGRVRFARFVYATSVAPYFNTPAALASFTRLAAPPLDGNPVTVATEQAVLAYDRAHPARPLAARYPVATRAALGSPELDYPYVLTSTNPLRLAAASAFGQALRGGYAQSVIRFAGFRSGSGVPDVFPRGTGLASQLLQVAPPAAASEAPAVLAAWDKLALGSRDLAVMDVSAVMGRRTAPGGPPLERELSLAASAGLALFPDTARMGLWEFAARLDGGRPYRQLVPVGPLTASLGALTRRADLQRVTARLAPVTGQGAALYGTILAAYRYMVASYQPGYYNAVLVLTAGAESTRHDISAATLIKRLGAATGTGRQVALIVVVFGRSPDFAALRQAAALTGGAAYQVSSPSQIGRVFFRAIAQRLCNPACAAP